MLQSLVAAFDHGRSCTGPNVTYTVQHRKGMGQRLGRPVVSPQRKTSLIGSVLNGRRDSYV